MSSCSIRLAYAEDHIAVRTAISHLLNLTGDFEVVIEAEHGRDLISKLEKTDSLPEICLLDISMPVMNGFDALVEIRKRWPEMKVLVLSSFQVDNYIIRMIQLGANGYLLKNCDPKELKSALWSILNNDCYYSSIAPKSLWNSVKSGHVKLPNLTEREIMVLKFSGSDLSYAEIAEKMNTTKRSVEGYRDSLFRKLNINSRVSLALYAVQAGFMPLETISTI